MLNYPSTTPSCGMEHSSYNIFYQQEDHTKAYLTLLAKLRDREALARELFNAMSQFNGWSIRWEAHSVTPPNAQLLRHQADALLAYLLPESVK